MADNNLDNPIYSTFFGVMGAASAIIFSGEYCSLEFPILTCKFGTSSSLLEIPEKKKKLSLNLDDGRKNGVAHTSCYVCVGAVLRLQSPQCANVNCSILCEQRVKKREFLRCVCVQLAKLSFYFILNVKTVVPKWNTYRFVGQGPKSKTLNDDTHHPFIRKREMKLTVKLTYK